MTGPLGTFGKLYQLGMHMLLQDRIFVDILNEPDSMGIRWEPSNGKPGARELYIGTMDALHQLSPTGWLYMVEGTGQNSFGLNWVRNTGWHYVALPAASNLRASGTKHQAGSWMCQQHGCGMRRVYFSKKG